MSTDKLQLTPESKRTLLEQSLQWIGSLKLQEDSDKNVPVFFSFTKLILINQSFLGTSRYASFDIYEFYLDYYQLWSPELYCLRFKSKHAGYFKGIKLSFERDYKLAKLLQPLNIGLDFLNEIEKKNLKELIEILKATTGKISMEVMGKIVPFNDVVNEFSSRICRFSCSGEFFTNCVMPSSFNSLDELKVVRIRNADQFLQISKCKVRSLDLTFIRGFSDGDPFELSMPTNDKNFLNKTVKQLRLYMGYFDYAMTQRIIEQILLFFPSLVELKIDAVPSLYEHSENQISNVASDLCQYMRALKDRLFANGLKMISLEFSHQFNCEEKCNSEWTNEASNKPEFKDWKFKLEHQSLHKHRYVVLQLNTQEGNNCKFGIELKGVYKAKASNDN